MATKDNKQQRIYEIILKIIIFITKYFAFFSFKPKIVNNIGI